MTNTTPRTASDSGPAGLPATTPTTDALLDLRAPAGPSFGMNLVNTLHHAGKAVHSFALGDAVQADVAISAFAALVCTGDTPAAALEAAAAAARQAPELEIHSAAWARVPGPREGTSEFQLTLTVTAADPETGEHGGSTHHSASRR
ncbi:hypothetical protein ACIPYQ_39730 [Streptomyces sp. NPDC090045]|uniref:hypothetical protein n=1 Tax=Streptomyces sp. NPDC090045 TaxID=3365927 RepID=UPI0037FA43CB